MPLQITGDQVKHEEYPTVIEEMLDWFFIDPKENKFSSGNQESDLPFLISNLKSTAGAL